MMVYVWGKLGGILICKNGKVEKVNIKLEGFKNGGIYVVWYFLGRYIVFLMNEI